VYDKLDTEGKSNTFASNGVWGNWKGNVQRFFKALANCASYPAQNIFIQ
jgi:hypothetical protein